MKSKRTKQSRAKLERIDTYDYLYSPPGSEVAEAGPRVKSSGLNGETVPGSIRLAIPASQVLQTVNVSKKLQYVTERVDASIEKEEEREKRWSNRPSSLYLKQV